jgi:hypothetical protein
MAMRQDLKTYVINVGMVFIWWEIVGLKSLKKKNNVVISSSEMLVEDEWDAKASFHKKLGIIKN